MAAGSSASLARSRRRQATPVWYRLRDPDLPSRRRGPSDRRAEAEGTRADPPAPVVVLVVDDQPEVRRTLARMLEEEEGVTVVEAADGIEALEQCSRHPVAVVVSDVRMPRMGGYELSRRLAATEPRIQVLLVTAYPEPDENETEPARVLLKPFSAMEFIAIVRSLARRHGEEVEGGGEEGG
jgi:CheY-like chemotaxis protein